MTLQQMKYIIATEGIKMTVVKKKPGYEMTCPRIHFLFCITNVLFQVFAFGVSLGIAGGNDVEVAPFTDKFYQLVCMAKISAGRNVRRNIPSQRKDIFNAVCFKSVQNFKHILNTYGFQT